ncbi:MAG: CoA transferase [Chloroflexi bacterium]|nr:CoA transferase [Chloroflexota bacterium]
MKRFADLSVVEIGGAIAGAYCAKLFADNGAGVSRVGEDQLTAAQRQYLHEGKAHFDVPPLELLAAADVIIESAPYGPLTPLELPDSRHAVRVRISPYGSSGPCASWRATDATLYAHSGHMLLVGDPDREPLSAPPHHPSYAAGMCGFIGAMGALFDRERHGRLHEVDVSMHEVISALHQVTDMRYQFGGDILRRMGNRYTGGGQPNAMYECSDGWVAISASTQAQAEMVLAVTGLLHLLDDPRISSVMDLQSYPELLDEHLVPWLKARPMDEVAELFQAARIPTAPARPMTGLLDDAQLTAREFWRQVDGFTVPGRPVRFGDIQGGDACFELDHEGPEPLSGVRVLDLARVWAGPLAARLLAELGAEVIQVEAPGGRGPRQIPDSRVRASGMYPNNEAGEHPWNRNGHQIKYGLHKESLVLDLTQADGRRTFERLVPHADVVIENYSPRVMPQFGLDEHRLHELNPGMIYVTMPGYGRSGPAMNWVAYGTSVDSHAGLSHLIGYPGHVPWKCGVAWPDPIAGLHAVAAVLIALWRRPEEGGLTIEIAQFEATLAVVGDALVEAQMRGEDAPVLGNRHPVFAPQGVYPTTGDDGWIAVSVFDDAAWRALCEAAALPGEWHGFDVSARWARHDEIDRSLASWTGGHEHIELARRLQAIGVAAAPVLDIAELLADEQLAARDALAEIDQPEVGRFVTPRSPIHFSGVQDRPPLRHAALFGEQNREILAQVGGLTDEEIDALVSAGIVVDEPPS